MPFIRPIDCPNILNIMMRTTVISSMYRTRMVRQTADLYLQPPVSQFKLLQFDAIDEIVEIGYSSVSVKKKLVNGGRSSE